MKKAYLSFFYLAAAIGLLCGVSSCSERSSAASHEVETSGGDMDSALTDSAAAAPAKDTLTFAFVGDIMMGTNYPESPQGAYLPSENGAKLFQDVAEILKSADVAAGNLEGTLLDRGGTAKKCSNPSICFAFRTPTSYVKNLVDIGMDFVSIANNHVNDFGQEGLSSTKKTLEEAGIQHAGLSIGPTTATVVRGGKRVGFAAFSPSRGTMSINDLDLLRRTVQQLRKNHDLVVISFHGGGEGKNFSHVPHKTEYAFGENRGDVEKFAHTAIDAGADIVYGHGPHVVRGAELYKDHLILYSLGNFCTPYRVTVSGISGHAPVAEVKIDSEGRFLEGKIHSFIQSKGVGPRKDNRNEVAAQIARLSREDFPHSPLKIAPDGTMSR